MKKRLVIAIIIALTVASQSWAAEKSKIAIFNPEQVLFQSEIGKKISDDLSAKSKTLNEKIENKRSELEKFKQDLEKKSALLSTEAKDEKEREYQKKYREFQQLAEDARYEMQQAQRNALEPLSNSLKDIIQKFGKEQGYALILDSRIGIPYAAGEIDITDKILELFNKQNKGQK